MTDRVSDCMNDWIVPDWPAPPNVRALFTTRNGGASVGPYASLNLGDHVGDDPLNVEKNRNLLRQFLPGEPMWLKQVHGTAAVDADNHSCMAPCDWRCRFQPPPRQCLRGTRSRLPAHSFVRPGGNNGGCHSCRLERNGRRSDRTNLIRNRGREHAHDGMARPGDWAQPFRGR